MRRDRHFKRPFKIWNVRVKKWVPYRNYLHEDRAREGLIKLVYWANPRDAYELIDTSKGDKVIEQAGRKAHGIWGLG